MEEKQINLNFFLSFHRSSDYRGDSNFNALFTPLTFLITYINSGVNPLLYAFLSRNFRKGMRELLLCSLKKNKNKSSNYRVPVLVSIEILHFFCMCQIKIWINEFSNLTLKKILFSLTPPPLPWSDWICTILSKYT